IIGKTLEFSALRRDGQEFPVELSISGLHLRGRWHAVGIVRDITQRKQAEQEMADREKLYRALFEKAGEAIVLLKDAKVMDCNAETLRMFACQRQDLVDHSAHVFYPETQRDGANSIAKARAIEKEVLAGRSQFFEWMFRRLDGSFFDAEVSLTKIDLGAESLLLSLVRDVSQRKQAEADLRHSEANLRKAQQIAHMGNWVLRSDDGWMVCSEEVARILGVEPAACQPSKEFFLSRVDPQDRERVANVLERALTDGSSFYLEHAIILESGERRFVVQQGEVELDQAGRPVQLLATIQDVTAARLAQVERAKLEAQLRQAQKLEAIGTLAGGIAHDFNNVLQGISGYNQLLLASGEISGVDRDRLGQIDLITQRAADMVRRLLTLARKVEFKQERVDLNREVGQTIQILEHTLPKMIRIQANLDPELKPIIGDPGQIVQVLLNLANNARQAMPQGGDLTFRTFNTFLSEDELQASPNLSPGEYVGCQVADTGAGMDPETQSHIFEPFFTTKPMGEGSGLGLSTVYGIVTNHGGRILCESLPGQGAVFTIFFPAMATSAIPTPEPTDQAPDTIRRGRGETVLVVDDEEGILDACREALQSLGYQVVTANSGERAMEVFGADPMAVDLVVMDLGMPGLGGLDCLRLMRALRGEIKVLVATGYAEDQVLDQLRELGVREVLAKPYRFRDLAARLQALLND
ncbi:MAG: PAS domain S-box protein, partial [Desulfarculus sp.]|nr:PAS domain S-box protein [Desulfarculus sp.]